MYLAYVDDSGNAGPKGTISYVLSCVLVDARSWPTAMDSLIDFRRHLNRTLRIPVRAEIKANYLLHNGGVFWDLKLSDMARQWVYRDHMRLHATLGFKTFAVLIHKKRLVGDPRPLAWERLFQRLERFTSNKGEPLVLFHDEGEPDLVRKIHRKSRRAGGAGSRLGTGFLSRPATLFIDDPSVRRSRDSYFIQLADLAAYAAYRRLYPPLGVRPVSVVPQDMWDELGIAILREANMYSGGPPGIVQGP